MKYKDDMSYINQDLVKRGLVKIVPFQIRFDRFFTEEAKNCNTCVKDNNNDKWNNDCKKIREKVADENKDLMEYLSKYYTLGQYGSNCSFSYNLKHMNDFDLWFWCRINKEIEDYSYVTLSFINKDKDIQRHEQIFKEIKNILEKYSANNIQAYFQYAQIENVEIMENEAKKIFEICKGKFINYKGYIGKLENYNGDYIFKKKNAKKYFYKVSLMDVCTNIIY